MPVCQSRIDPLHDKAFTVITWGHLAVVFGTAYGGVTPLFAVLAREYFGQLAMRAVFEAAGIWRPANFLLWAKLVAAPLARAVLHCRFVSIEKVEVVRIGHKADLVAESWELFAIMDDETGLPIRQFDMHQRHSARVFVQCNLAAQDVLRGFDDRQMFGPNADAFGRRRRS